MGIDKLAVVSKDADIAQDVEVGPYAIVEDGVKIGPRVKIWPHAYICNGTEIGEDTQVHMGAILGHLPQDLAYQNGKTYLKIGKRNIIREHVTIHRGTKDGSCTLIGDDNYFMAASHAGHNCEIGNKVAVSNGALLAGYVKIEDGSFVSGNVVVHQFCRIGALAMIGGFTGVNKDVPPYMLVRGPSIIRSVNLVGLRRAGFPKEVIASIKEAFRLIYRSDLNITQALEAIEKLSPSSKELQRLVTFIKESKRGICDTKYTDEMFYE